MKMSKRNIIYVIISCLLIIIIVSSTILSRTLKKQIDKKNEIQENLYNNDNKLVFKNEFGKKVGDYKCRYSNCDYASTIYDDENYPFESLKSDEQTYNKIINDKYVLLYDYEDEADKKVLVYDFKNKSIVLKVDNIKNYNTDLENNYFIFENDNKFGLMKLDKKPSVVIKNEFDFIGVANIIEPSTNNLIVDKLLTKKDNKWMIVDLTGKNLSLEYDDPIVNYNGLYLIVYKDNSYKLYNYDGNEFFKDNKFSYINFVAKYVNIVENNMLRIIDPQTNKVIASNIKLENNNYSNDESYVTTIEGNTVGIDVISNNGEIKNYTFNIK